jgi:hypothetical protein
MEEIAHSGTRLNLRMILEQGRSDLRIIHESGTELVVTLNDGLLIDMACPTVEGDVIIIFCTNGREVFCDAVTGKILTAAELNNWPGGISIHI